MTPVGLWKGSEDEFGVVLGSQWPSRRPATGVRALAAALLVNAVREAGLLGKAAWNARPGERVLARAWLTGQTDGTEPLPLPVVCQLAGLNPDRVTRVVRQRLEAAP